ncbi:MAG: nucleotidyl transferase AbiEii/AbiGii toxin family protein [Micrococcales bacterium]
MNLKTFKSEVLQIANQEGITAFVLERIVAIAIVEQLFFQVASTSGQAAYLKGGSGMIWRFGYSHSRATRDIDAVVALDRQEVAELIDGLVGANFSFVSVASVKLAKDKTKAKVPAEYRILTTEVQLKVADSNWLTVELEILPRENSVANVFKQQRAPSELVGLFERLGLGVLAPLPTITLDLQLAEKLHALTEPGSDRASDLYDISLLVSREAIDYKALAAAVTRVFARRQVHPWNAGVVLSPLIKAGFIDQWGEVKWERAEAEFYGLIDQISAHIVQG